MNRSIPTTDAEHMSAVDRLRADARREVLLRLAERGLGSEVARELAGIDDLDALEERVLALLRRA